MAIKLMEGYCFMSTGADSKEFIISTGDIKHEYDIISFVEAKEVDDLKNKAIRLGANGLIFVRMNTYTYETGGTINGLGSYTSHIENSYYGTAVKIVHNDVKEEPVVSKYENIDCNIDNVNYQFSLNIGIYKEKLSIGLSFDNNGSKSIRAISLDLIINTIWGEDIVFDNLHFYPVVADGKVEYVGSRYHSNVSCSLPTEDIDKSYEKATISINRILYGKELGVMPENPMWGDMLI